ncbi:MAG TPA: hypothetical protein VD867_08775 [Burkholderiales bacterium]|nr:hypothetical protein [Burkholderiales bacterium]
MAIEFTDFDVWTFRKDDADKWHWQRLSPDGEILIAAAMAFGTMEECMDDARRRGYKGTDTSESENLLSAGQTHVRK